MAGERRRGGGSRDEHGSGNIINSAGNVISASLYAAHDASSNSHHRRRRRHRFSAEHNRLQPWGERPVLGRGTAQNRDFGATGGGRGRHSATLVRGGFATASSSAAAAASISAASSSSIAAAASVTATSTAASNTGAAASAASSAAASSSATSSAARRQLAMEMLRGLGACGPAEGGGGGGRRETLEKGRIGLCFSCKLASTGCPVALISNHDAGCDLRPYPCPCPGATACPWHGSLRGVLPHLAQAHPTVPHQRGTNALFQASNLEHPPPTFWLMVQVCLGQQFLMVLEKCSVAQEVRFATSLLLVGPGDLAPSFTYRVELGSSRHRRLSYEAAPRPLRDGVARVIADKDALFFSQEVARLFTENDSLLISFSIRRC